MSPFQKKIVEIVKMVPQGKVVSYGQVALMAGIPRAAQAVGQTLRSLEDDIVTSKFNLPWWRVVNNAGRVSIKGAKYHTAKTQKQLLEEEGIEVRKNLTFEIEKYRFRPPQKVLDKLELPDEYISVLIEKYLL